MQKLAKHITITESRKIPQLFDTAVVAHKVPKTANEKKLELGISLRNQLLPANVQQGVNSVGFTAHPDKSTIGQYNDKRYLHVDDHFGRVARIYVQDTNHMHDTPTLPKGYKWCLELERHTVWKNNAMGWTYNNDSLSKRNVYFADLDAAIQYCKLSGLGYEIEYPKFRYAKKKNYSSNFVWPGHDNAVDNDC